MSLEFRPQGASEPFDFRYLNGQYYQEEGPDDYILGRLYALVAVGGSTDGFMDLIAPGAEFHGVHVRLQDAVVGDDEAAAREQNQRFLDHYVRIEMHSLKHLAIETLLRLFLGHRDLPPCPWQEITRVFSPGQFKKAVKSAIVDAGQEQLERDVGHLCFASDLMPDEYSDDEREAARNLAGFMRRFATAWLSEAKSYNSTKHGLTAIPGSAVLEFGPVGEERVKLGEGDSLAHLTFENGSGGGLHWSLTTRWIGPSDAMGTIVIIQLMLKSLWSIARCRYGFGDNLVKFALPPDVYSPETLDSNQPGAAAELSIPLFVETTGKS
ncbi:hypothetical protein [Candidatus Poriferisodalis sp.]|uniref:hypothetical protein n=1 Tax=Candidatus Poriferisodalis sp. TaxID=3101277 RepID=UPI003B02683A